MKYIEENHPHLQDLYDNLYKKKDKSYWENLNEEISRYCTDNGLKYLRDDDSMKNPFNEPLIVVNYFYHEKITKSAKRKAKN